MDVISCRNTLRIYLVNAVQSSPTVKIVKLEQNSHNFEHVILVHSRCPNEQTKIHFCNFCFVEINR